MRKALLCAALATGCASVEINGGVGLGVLQVGTTTKANVSPQAGAVFRSPSGAMVSAHDTVMLLPADDGLGVDNQLVVGVGYGLGRVNVSAGGSLAIYSMPVCGATLCGRVVGAAPGGHARADVYLAGPFGISVNGDVAWYGGRSAVLPGGPAAMVTVGPVFRWSSR